MKVIFAAYRDWAKEAVARLATHPRLTFVKHASSLEELERKVADAIRERAIGHFRFSRGVVRSHSAAVTAESG